MKRARALTALFLYLSCMIAGFALTSRDAPETDVPDYKQYDERWAAVMYSNHGDPAQTIKSSGCGLCAMANVVAYFCDPTVTPVDMAELSLWNGYCADAGGTKIGFHRAIIWFYPLNVEATNDISEALRCLDEGGLVIAVMQGGLWIKAWDRGTKLHAVTLYAHIGEDIYIHDSAAPQDIIGQIVSHSTAEKVQNAAKVFYCYLPKPGLWCADSSVLNK